MKPTVPLACNMGVFTTDQREAHIRTTNQLFQAVQGSLEREGGFEFTFLNDTNIQKIGEFIANEKLCCPFLKFALTVNSNTEPISLLLTGPEGTQEFLREEFSEAFA